MSPCLTTLVTDPRLPSVSPPALSWNHSRQSEKKIQGKSTEVRRGLFFTCARSGMSSGKMFKEVRAGIALKIFPSKIGDIKTAVNRELSCMLLRSEAQLGGGVPVAFSGVDIAGDSAGIFEDTPQLHVTCAVTFLCFAPDEGQLVKGVVNNTASDSVGLLVLDTFNASITAEGLKGYVHSAARGVWHKEGDEEDEITIGQEIEFVCVEMRTHDKLVLISGHLPGAGGAYGGGESHVDKGKKEKKDKEKKKEEKRKSEGGEEGSKKRKSGDGDKEKKSKKSKTK